MKKVGHILEHPCPDCGGDMVLRDSKRFGPFYGCTHFPDCKATHGAHGNDSGDKWGEPLGVPADQATKDLRHATHAVFDRIWKNCHREYGFANDHMRQTARKRCYAWLADRLELAEDDCHIGAFDADQCRQAIEICRGVNYGEIRAWAKQPETCITTAKLKGGLD
jgi:ssDNA-binding Zn-finger/Zn-ribbon topoisomerase 1